MAFRQICSCYSLFSKNGENFLGFFVREKPHHWMGGPFAWGLNTRKRPVCPSCCWLHSRIHDTQGAVLYKNLCNLKPRSELYSSTGLQGLAFDYRYGQWQHLLNAPWQRSVFTCHLAVYLLPNFCLVVVIVRFKTFQKKTIGPSGLKSTNDPRFDAIHRHLKLMCCMESCPIPTNEALALILSMSSSSSSSLARIILVLSVEFLLYD